MAKNTDLKRLKNIQCNLLKIQQQAWKKQKLAWMNLQSAISVNASKLTELTSDIDNYQKILDLSETNIQGILRSSDNFDDRIFTLIDDFFSLSGEVGVASEAYKRAVEELLDIRNDLEQVDQEFKNALEDSKRRRLPRGYKQKEIAKQAGVPKQYLDSIKVKKDETGVTHIFFGGVGSPTGPGHAHYVIDTDNKVKYRREPNAPHGMQNFI